MERSVKLGSEVEAAEEEDEPEDPMKGRHGMKPPPREGSLEVLQSGHPARTDGFAAHRPESSANGRTIGSIETASSMHFEKSASERACARQARMLSAAMT